MKNVESVVYMTLAWFKNRIELAVPFVEIVWMTPPVHPSMTFIVPKPPQTKSLEEALKRVIENVLNLVNIFKHLAPTTSQSLVVLSDEEETKRVIPPPVPNQQMFHTKCECPTKVHRHS
jgi:hypothetical protein